MIHSLIHSFTHLSFTHSFIHSSLAFLHPLRTFFFFLLLRNMKLWKEAIEARRNREIVITIAEMVLFVFSFGCFPSHSISF